MIKIHHKVGDYIAERNRNTCNIKIAKIIKVDFEYESYTIEIVKTKKPYTRYWVTSFDMEYVHSLYKPVSFNKAELLALVL